MDKEALNLRAFNMYGGFNQKGDEYHILNTKTPVPWCNVMANEHFGTIVSSYGTVYSYYKNSQGFKISNWCNDWISFKQGETFEGIYDNNYNLVYGFGYTKVKQEDDENFFTTVSAKIWSFLCLTLIFAAITLIFPNLFTKLHDKYETIEIGEIIEVFTKGLVALILIPIIIILLFCTLIGIPLAIILLLFYGIAIYLSTIFVAYVLGYKIWQKVFDKDINILALGLIGLFILFLCSLIPGVRTLVSIITTLIGLGLIVSIFKK